MTPFQLHSIARLIIPVVLAKERISYKDFKPIIAVTMATGRQGQAVVRHLSKKGLFKIRAITRNPFSKVASELSKLPNVEIFKGDLLDQESLNRGFEDAYGIFGNTTPTKGWTLFRGSMVSDYEREQGKFLIDAVRSAREKGHLKHFVFSSICKAKEPLMNDPAPGHFSTKWNIEEYLISNNLIDLTTILRPVSYFENFYSDLPGINISDTTFPGVVDSNTPWQTIAVDDIGLWTNVVIENPEKFIGQQLNIAGEEMTGNEMAQLLQELSPNIDKQVKYFMVPRNLMRFIEHDIATMAAWIERAGYGADIEELNRLATEFDIEMTPLSKWLHDKLTIRKKTNGHHLNLIKRGLLKLQFNN